MKRNFNKSGRFIRIVLGLLLMGVSLANLTGDGFMDNVMLGIGVFLLATALFLFCPLYYFLGIDTSKPKDRMKMY